MDKNNIWIDLTDFIDWKGHFSGIQRVIYCYSIRYKKDGARFFIYSKIRDNFYEVSPKYLDSKTKHKNYGIKLYIHNAYNRLLPLRLRIITNSFLSRGSCRIARLFRRIQRKLEVILKVFLSFFSRKSLFAKDDKVIILGAGWQSQGFAEKLGVLKKRSGFKVIHMVHDILPISQPHLFDEGLCGAFSDYMSKALPLCDTIISDSEATHQDILEFAKEARIVLTENNIVRRIADDSYTKIKPKKPGKTKSPSKPFIFSLGTLEVRKNHQLLYQAYKIAESENIQMPQLVIVGKPGWLATEFFKVLKRDRFIKDKILVVPGLSDAEVLWLYNNCLFSIYPSLCEGWGLTISDSIGRGKLCLTCNTSSMPEVAGDLIDYFSPYDARDCLNKILYYYQNKQALKSKEKRIANYKITTWDDTFVALKEVVER